MSRDLQPDQVLQDRFVLLRCLRVAASSQLWSARDRHLDTPLLLRVYFTGTLAESGVLVAIKRDARHSRRLRHSAVARIHDVHEHDDLLIVSIEPREGRLLSDVLEDSEPMPYRRAIETVRPVVEALQHMHESGGEHGRLDTDHLLVDDEGQWALLPGDSRVPARNDMQQLGHVMAQLLTGGRAPDADRPLNDLAELLDEGRTLPAMLDQLVTDLRMSEPALRPSSMREVLHRLDQLEDFVETEPPPAPPVSSETPPASTVHVKVPAQTRARTSWRARIAYVLVPIILLVGAVALFSIGPDEGDDGEPGETPVEQVATTDPPPDTDPAPDPEPGEPEVDPAKLAAEKAGAEEALNRYLTAKRDVDDMGASTWAGESYAIGAGAAAEADQAFLAQDFVTAAGKYDEATAAFETVVAGKSAALDLLLAEGEEALAAPDAARASAAFRSALLIDPGHSDAKIGLQRAGTLDELIGLMASGADHENEGRLALAQVDYAAAAQLDPYSDEASLAFRRIKDRLANEEFGAMMSAGLEAFHLGKFDEARELLLEAKRFRDVPAVDAALRMVQEGRVRAEVERLRTVAVNHETHEQWQAAWTTYRRVLAIDPAIEFAQEGRTRAEQWIEIEKRVRRYLDAPELIVDRTMREDARILVEELQGLPGKGPKFQQACDRLAELVRLANTPVRVMLTSDDETSVDVYRVGRYEPFASKTLELLPGKYTVVGHRKGYKDVRHILSIKPGDSSASLEIVCTESI